MDLIINRILFPLSGRRSKEEAEQFYYLNEIPLVFYSDREDAFCSSTRESTAISYHHHPSSQRVLLYAHGNGCYVRDFFHDLKNIAVSNHLSLCVPEYDGYFNTLRASPWRVERNLYDAYSFLIEKGWRSDQIIIYGRSIGTGPAAALAERLCEKGEKAAALILATPFASVRSLVKYHASWVPYILVSNQFNTEQRVRACNFPLIIVVCQNDEVCPIEDAYSLKECNPAARLIVLPGGHNDIDESTLIRLVC